MVWIKIGRWWIHRITGQCVPIFEGGHDEFVPATQHFGFYEDGTETGAVIIGSEDTNIVRLNDSDSQLHLRYMVEEVGGGDISGATTDDYTIEYDVNSLNIWTLITASSSRVKTDTGSDLTDGNATTDRLTGGAGLFLAGIQEEGDSEVTDYQLTFGKYTNHVFALNLVAADNADNDTLDFRMLLNTKANEVDNNVTPRITIDKTGGAPTRRIMVVT